MAQAINIGTLLVEREHANVWTIHPHQTLREVARGMTTHNVGALAVTDDDGDLVGIVSERDLTRAIRCLRGRSGQQACEPCDDPMFGNLQRQ